MRDPNVDTPSAVVKSITEHGGLNQYGKPYWRVILSHNHTRPKRGMWCDWGDGKVEQFSLEGAKLRHNAVHPQRVVDEVRDTPVWPKEGWILERWFPAEVWAPNGREGWTNASPFPEEGEYYLIAPGPNCQWDELPELNDLKQAISMWERDYLDRPRDFDMAYAMFVAEEKVEEERQAEKAREDLEYFLRHEVIPIMNSSSLEAGRIREAAENQ